MGADDRTHIVNDDVLGAGGLDLLAQGPGLVRTVAVGDENGLLSQVDRHLCGVLAEVAQGLFPPTDFVDGHQMARIVHMTTVSVAFVNTLFRFVTVLVLTPFIGKLEKLVDLFIKDKPDARRETEDFNRLEERFVDHPALAIEQSRLTINSMARRAQENLYASIALLGNYTDDGFQRVKDSEDAIDGYEDKLGTYLVKVTAQELADKQNEDVSKFLHTISDFERISDHALNIAELAQEIHEKNMRFSPAASHELTVLQGAVTEVLSTAVEAFISNDMDTAYHVEPLEELIDNLCDEMKLHHIERVQKGICTLTQGFVFNDLLTNYERVSDHCSNIAVAMIELESDTFETHSYLDGVKEMHSHSFDRYYEEFSKKYSL